ncbi:hypothetical protein AAUPMC_02654 [Pasteurella multocida subsp. multocida str. Anand1_cattle]|nr:hypothetical protein AAUPMC_02654 [Pasteurella multocida subsp. multocida str. Anand1_cattle]
MGKKEEGQDSSADSQTQTETQIEKQPALSTATVESPSSVQADSTPSPPPSAESVEKQAITEHHTESSAVSMDEKNSDTQVDASSQETTAKPAENTLDATFFL